jgi:hypothetical protein
MNGLMEEWIFGDRRYGATTAAVIGVAVGGTILRLNMSRLDIARADASRLG